jgi:hypothetical protein
MNYKVTKQFGRSPQTDCGNFNNLEHAQIYVVEKLGEDVRMNITTTTYRVLDVIDEVVAEYNAKNYEEIAATVAKDQADIAELVGKEEPSSQGQGSGASFRPTPFNTTAKPKGAQQNWMKEDDEDKDK